jgi:RNA polymerase sigma-70 factor (ECF subfamily)
MDDALAIRLAGGRDEHDAELARAATHDPAAFGAIYERHRAAVYRYLRARTSTDADAQDLAATTFERAMAAIHQFQPVGGGMAAWLIRIARNAHLARSEGRRTPREVRFSRRSAPVDESR